MTDIRTPLTASRKDKLLSRRYVEGLIADGSWVIIFEGRALKVNAWTPFHPGGDKSMQHMVGKDATDEINAYVLLFCQMRLPTPCLLTLTYIDCIRKRLARKCFLSRSDASKNRG